MGLRDVLSQFGFDLKSKSRMVRHQDTRPGVQFIKVLLEKGEFDEYQSWQSRPVFHALDYVVSFVGDGPGRARFRGVYRVLGNEQISFELLPKTDLWPWKPNQPHHRYEMHWVPEFEPLVGQLVIQWFSERSWVQHLKNSEILESPKIQDIDLPPWNPIYVEGKPFTYLARSRERSLQARDKCLEIHGAKCGVCQMNFPEAYGGLGTGYMHVHHTTTVASQKSEYQLDPEVDLQPVCPNCHAMLHWGTEIPRTIEELRKIRAS